MSVCKSKLDSSIPGAIYGSINIKTTYAMECSINSASGLSNLLPVRS